MNRDSLRSQGSLAVHGSFDARGSLSVPDSFIWGGYLEERDSFDFVGSLARDDLTLWTSGYLPVLGSLRLCGTRAVIWFIRSIWLTHMF